MTTIPKIIHRIWFGPSEIPADYGGYWHSWHELHPGWQLITWNYDNLPELRNQQLFDDIKRGALRVNPGAQPTHSYERLVAVQLADLVAYELLWRYGGIYTNCDVECVRSLEPALEDVAAFAGIEIGQYLCNAVMGGVPEHRVFDEILTRIDGRVRTNPDRPMNEQTGPYLLTEVVLALTGLNTREPAHIPGLFTIFPKDAFYPFLYGEAPRVAAGSFTLHHWGHQRKDH